MLVLPGFLLLAGVATPAPTGYRMVYPLSVLPGGLSGVNIEQARLSDPVLMEAWSGVHALSPAVLRGGRFYLQYRRGGEVGWTREPRLIKAGEPVMVDQQGELVRYRCGNRMCSKPRRPFVPFIPPPEKDDDKPEVTWLEPPLLFPEWHLWPGLTSELPPAPPANPPLVIQPPSPYPPEGLPPREWPPVPLPAPPVTTNYPPPIVIPPIWFPPSGPRQPVFPPAVIPEPVSWSLSALGLGLVGLMVRNRKR